MEDIARFTLDDLKVYYQTYYNPVNAFLVVVGDFKKERSLPQKSKRPLVHTRREWLPTRKGYRSATDRRAKNLCEEGSSTPVSGDGISCPEPSRAG